jgi:Aldehyde dehydrogenase family
MAPVTYPRRLHELAVEDPDALALTVVDPGNENRSFTRADLDQGAAALARALADAGVRQPPRGAAPGAFMQATVFSHVDPNSEIAQQEVFGPVLTVFSSEDDDEAVTMATRPSTDSPHSSTPGRSRAPTPWRGASKRVRWRSTAAGPRQSWWRGHAIRWRQGKWLRP